MRMSRLFTRTAREAPKDEVARSAILLARGGFIHKHMAGVYTLLPLGLRVMAKLEHLVRGEMEAVGGQELVMNTLQERSLWERTGRWAGYQGAMYQFADPDGQETGLAPTHEEVAAEIATRFIRSYRDLPAAIYQFQTKFRFEARPRSGLLRSREFRMKDLYSFHADAADLDRYYWEVAASYRRIFDRLGLPTVLVEASGGPFSREHSHEFQAPSAAGEDTIFVCEGGEFAQNRDVYDDRPRCPAGHAVTASRAIEVGNIFRLGTRYSEPLGLRFTDRDGERRPVLMASYGIGITRLIAACVEVLADGRGMRWPGPIAPYTVSLLALGTGPAVLEAADGLYDTLTGAGIEVLFDDRDVPGGEKLADADLIGLPWRLVVSERTVDQRAVELKARGGEVPAVVSVEAAVQQLRGGS